MDARRGNRSQVILATKAGAKPTYPGGGFENKEGLSLKRLRTDYIDMYYTHIDDKDVSLEETLETLDRFVRSGKVRAIGCSNYQTPRLHEALTASRHNTWAAYSCIQQRYTYLQPDPKADFGVQVVADDELLDYCHNNNMTVLAYSPLLGGAYTRADQLSENLGSSDILLTSEQIERLNRA
ncbi:General stress protein 69 [compost metagenome]